MATLVQCRTLVRGFTGRLDPYQTPDEYIDSRINEFYTIDFAERLNLQEEVQPYVLLLTPSASEYSLPANFVRFQGDFTCDNQHIYAYTDPGQFYSNYPLEAVETPLGLGNGSTAHFQIDIGPGGAVPGSIIITSLAERFTCDLTGALIGSRGGSGSYAAQTGQISIDFARAPTAGDAVVLHYQALASGAPTAALVWSGSLRLNSAPDRFYVLTGYVCLRSSPLVNDSDQLLYPQWLRYIAYGASAKICEESGEFDASSKLMPFMEREKNLVLARTNDDLFNTRSAPSF